MSFSFGGGGFGNSGGGGGGGNRNNNRNRKNNNKQKQQQQGFGNSPFGGGGAGAQMNFGGGFGTGNSNGGFGSSPFGGNTNPSFPQSGGSQSKQPCRNFQQTGHCKFGAKCRFSHQTGFGAQSASSSGSFFGGGNKPKGNQANNVAASSLVPLLPSTTSYSQAGILPYRFDPNSGKLYVLVSVEYRKESTNSKSKKDMLCVLGGAKQSTDTSYLMTATREFWERSGQLIPQDHCTGMLAQLERTADTSTNACFSYPKGKYVLVIYSLQHDLDIVERFAAAFPPNAPSRRIPAGNPGQQRSPPKSLEWVMVESLYATANLAGSGGHSAQLHSGKQMRVHSLLSALLNEPLLGHHLGSLQSSGAGGGAGAGAGAGLTTGSPGSVAAPASIGAASAQFDTIGRQFAEAYYSQFNSNKQLLAQFFTNDSLFSCEQQQLRGAQSIITQLQQFGAMRMQITRVDCQPGPAGAVLLMCTGQIDNPPSHFRQVFQLVPANNSYSVLNMMLRAIH